MDWLTLIAGGIAMLNLALGVVGLFLPAWPVLLPPGARLRAYAPVGAGILVA